MKKNIFLGIDIGATKTFFLVVKFPKSGFEILESMRCETPHGEKQILDFIKYNYKSLAERHEIEGIGIGFAGPVDYKKDVALFGPNMKTKKIEFKKDLKKDLKIPIEVDNDAKCFILAESAFGLAKGFKDVVAIVVGTGIGGAVIAAGNLYRGASNFAGEFGHTLIGEEGFEAAGSGSGLSRVYKGLTGKKLDSYKIVDLAKKGDTKAKKAVDANAKKLGILLANVINIFNPELIVLGGGMSKVGIIVNKAKGYARKKIFVPSLIKTPIVVSKLEPAAVALGAAWMVKNSIDK